MNRIWKEIKGFEGLYQVSNLGEIKSKRKILKPFTTSNNYLKVKLSKNSKTKDYFVHRLVAEAFVSNPNGFLQVNHIDENIQNNKFNNLEWCDHSYNQNYGTRNKKVQQKLGTKINQYDLDGNFIKTFDSIREAQRECHIRHIEDCVKGKFKQMGGYVWKVAEERKCSNE